MGKKNKHKEQLPEGMSRRQAKLEARAAERAKLDKDPRPYQGLAMEADLVAMQEFIPSATAPLQLKDGSTVTLCTVLPGAVAALRREDGEALVALQVAAHSHNPGRDLAHTLSWVTAAAPGETLGSAAADGSQPEITELIDPDTQLDITVYNDFSWWIPEGGAVDPQYAHTLKQANDSLMPSAAAGLGWWIDAGDKAHIRWVRTDAEEPLLQALARVSAAGKLHLGEDTKFAGVFRTHGVVVPVFDLDPTAAPEEFVAPLAQLDETLKAAFSDEPLTAAERRKLENIKSRQVTIR